ncbi:predicted protein [Botrytis cinerea T4]|uniref:Uncharacterized protein n=1 Tax=Botryotinia fuckeliana (strain T4) TaxID=999810 RepID=G2XZ80_BOTF4|nr:predicted protein [Botrytis cinerea T4]
MPSLTKRPKPYPEVTKISNGQGVEFEIMISDKT